MPYKILVSTMHGKKKKLHKNNKFKISTPTWNYKFRLPEGSYSVLNIQE